jgi:hypothetical protein
MSFEIVETTSHQTVKKPTTRFLDEATGMSIDLIEEKKSESNISSIF